ncbi:MAG: hypothetical protein HQL45_00625 [Alphaproteobacteria bacterium]|nr:hypothetical protein [Alphaproteobacteria bacterium]
MHRLEGSHKGDRALVFMGGPSLLENQVDISRLAGMGFTVFLESKALTERFLDWGLPVDYYLMFYPDKAKSTSFQMVVLQALLSKLDLKPLVRPERHAQIDYMLSRLDSYFSAGKQNITHKRLKWNADVFLPGSPFELLPNLKQARLIAYRPALETAVDKQSFSQEMHTFDTDDSPSDFSLENYYKPLIRDGRLVLQSSRLTNSAAIALYPLLKFMGFSKVYFLGSDMSMLGTMEHAAPFTFLSMTTYRQFFERARRAFGTHFPSSDRRDALEDLQSRLMSKDVSTLFSLQGRDSFLALLRGQANFRRPRSEMRMAMRLLTATQGIEFINVFEPYSYALPAEGIRNISFEQMLLE